MAESLKEALVRHLGNVEALSEDELVAQRYTRLRGQGVYRAVS
jgi:acetyl-CoA carboxylase alpha subunit